ncbi:ABC transporter substrate-binding protein [Chloroflexia bacterium SDU3-3]|nr:ABC transporter substrate-binding protein [Chloroflexia bacterium SDU3-3]
MRWRVFPLMVAMAVLAACGSTATGAATALPSAPAATAGALTPVTIAMPYVPNVQFAHFYVAVAKGYYAAEGLDVSFDYKYETDSIQRVAQGTAQFGMAGGDMVLLARAQGLPIVTVATNSQRFATVFYSKADQKIVKPEDLRGKSVGIPGRFGAAYVGLQALLYATKIPESDLNIQEVGFNQVAALSEDKVQVASGYGNNEPIQLQQAGLDLNVIKVSDYFPLASDGIITSEKLISEQPELVRGFLKATLHGMQDAISDPSGAFAASLDFIPELKGADAAGQKLQQRVLDATIGYWQSDATVAHGLGYTESTSWQATATFLRDSGILKTDVALDKAYTNDFLPK